MFASTKSLLLLIFAAIICSSSQNESDCMVQLASGKIKGNCEHAMHDAYTKVPYAKPPLGELRFEESEDVEPWDDVRDATAEPVLCVQFFEGYANMEGSEDCLYANVYVSKERKSKDEKMPVMIYIYPGAFQFGSPANEPELLMSTGNVILVTFAYRTGPLGFLSAKDKVLPGNNGLKDQRRALEWVAHNIEAFGGDKSNMLLFGCSAGSASVEYHLLTGNKIPKAFVSLSGSVLNPYAFDENPLTAATEFGKQLDCPFTKDTHEFKNCLKKKTTEEIWKTDIAMHKYYGYSPALFRPTVEDASVENAFMIKHPMEMLKNGEGRMDAYYLKGVVEGEGNYLAGRMMALNDKKIEIIEELNEKWQEVCPIMFFCEDKSAEEKEQICSKLRKDYMCGMDFNKGTYKLLDRMFGDEYFYNGIDVSTKWHKNAGRKVMRYEADLPLRYNWGNVLANDRLDVNFGSVHAVDVFAIIPLDFKYPEIQMTKQQTETKLALINLFKSMLGEDTPKFMDTTLKILDKTSEMDECLFFDYESHKMKTCGMPQYDCADYAANPDKYKVVV